MLKGNALSNDATYVNNIKMVSCGEYHTVLLDNSGYVYACGYNGNGELGDGTTNNSSVLVQMLAGNALSNDGTYVNNIKMISCGQYYTLLLDNSGYVYACGSNSVGQFGDGTTTDSTVLVQMISGNALSNDGTYVTNIQSIACGQRTSFVLDISGYVYGCGYNVDGQLGDGTTTNSSQLVRMLSGNALSNDGTYVTNIKEITIGIQSTTVLDNSGYVYSCGNNRGGQFGIGIGNSSNTLVQMLSGESVHGDVYGVNNVSHISCSGRTSIMILDASGYVYGTGSNDFGILGIGNITLTSTLVRILAGQAQNYDSLGVTNIGGITSSHYNAYLLDLSGYIYGCGRNKYGELGINSSVQNQTTLVQMLSGNVLPADSTATGFAQNMVRMMDSNSIALPQNLPTVICFKEGTKILALNSQFVDEFIPVEELKQGDLIKTHKHGYKKLESIGFSNIYNSGDDERTKNRLYIYKKQDIQELAEDVVVTGCHSVLVDRLTEKEKEETIKQTKRVFVTDDKYRLMAFLDSASKPYTDEGNFKIWHFCLENENIYMNYGVFAGGTTYGNAKPGLLVESASHFSLKTYSNMTIITNSAITNQ
jgi:alpha-tubulin suppressor-like RCC1 family protein